MSKDITLHGMLAELTWTGFKETSLWLLSSPSGYH